VRERTTARADWILVLAVALIILGLSAILGTCADTVRAQTCPSPYCPGGVAVRVYDGGTGAHDAFTARRNLGIGASSLLGLRDSLSSLFYSAIQDPLLRVKDAQFWVKDDVDTTKKFQFQASPITTGTTRTYNMPNANGTFPLLETANTFTRGQTITSGVDEVGFLVNHNTAYTSFPFEILDQASSTLAYVDGGGFLAGAGGFGILNPLSGNYVQVINKSAIGAVRSYKIDNSITGTPDFVMTSGTQTISGAKTYNGSTIINAGRIQGRFPLFVDGTAAHVSWADNADSSKKVAVNVGSVTTATTRTRNELDLTATPVLVGDDPPAVAAGALGKVDLTAQTANITTTALSNAPPAGLYEVQVILMCTTAAGAAGTIRVTLGWTDNVGATTSTPVNAFPLTATGRASGFQTLRVSSGDITYAVTVTGIYSTAAYAVYLRVIALG
jgi:autotransporter-associated beta strand protein